MSSARASARSRDADEGGRSLPLPVSALIGRDAELQIVRRWFADPTARLVTFIGPGGVGKTRLAVEIARAIAREGSMRVAFVPLAPLRDPAFVASAIAEALGLADVGAQDLPKRARAACEDCPTLMVLDNFEHLLDAASLVADLLATVPSLRLLVTSRAPLRVRGERDTPSRRWRSRRTPAKPRRLIWPVRRRCGCSSIASETFNPTFALR